MTTALIIIGLAVCFGFIALCCAAAAGAGGSRFDETRKEK
jgi:hypothetical protein